MKKIIFVAPNLKNGGAESVLVKILNNFNSSLFEVKLVLLKKEGEHILNLDKNIEIIDLNALTAFQSLYRLKKIINVEKPDIVYSIIGHVNIMLSILKSFCFNDIIFIGRENAVYSEYFKKNITLKKIVMYCLYKIFLKRTSFIIAQSEYMKNQIIDLFSVPKSKIFIFNNPVELDKIDNILSNSGSTELVDNGNVNLIAVGRLEEVKNYTEIIDLIEILPQQYQLNILGEGSLKKKLQQYVDDKNLIDRIKFYGHKNNPYQFMRDSDILIITSHRESFPNVVLEANACGTYAISYDMPGGIQEIIDNNINGNIVPFGDCVSLRNEVIRIINQGYDPNKVRQSVESYSITRYMEKLYDLFDNVVD